LRQWRPLTGKFQIALLYCSVWGKRLRPRNRLPLNLSWAGY
jgi:hypothetical protein